MKRLAAILLLSLLAFNWIGYRLFMNLLEQEASVSLQSQIDRDQYEDEGLVEVKIPMNLPYLSGWSTFEKFQGETQINGIHYKYVKRKLVNDTLILLCIPNTAKNELRTAQSDYFNQVNDLQKNDKKNNPGKDHTTKIPIVDYLLKESNIEMMWSSKAEQHRPNYSGQLSFLSRKVAEQPPEC